MAEKAKTDNALLKIGEMLKGKRMALGEPYNRSRELFIERRSEELFGSEDWISLRHLYNIENGKNWISIEKLIVLADALEIKPEDLFSEIVAIYRNSHS